MKSLTLLFFFVNLSVIFSLVFFFLCFLDWEPLKSCFYMSLGVIFMAMNIFLGLHGWYCYFVMLVFLSGVLSLLTFLSSMSVFYSFNNYGYIVLCVVFIFLLFLFFDWSDFFLFLNNFGLINMFSDFNFAYIFFMVMVFFLLLFFISMSMSNSYCMRGLWVLNSFSMSDYGSASIVFLDLVYLKFLILV